MPSSDKQDLAWGALTPDWFFLPWHAWWDKKKAREIWFLCRQYNAQDALNMGLVNKVVPLEQLEDEYVQWAEEMMLLSPLALRMIKAGLNAELDGQAGIQELAGDATMLYYLTDEAQEGKRFPRETETRLQEVPQIL